MRPEDANETWLDDEEFPSTPDWSLGQAFDRILAEQSEAQEFSRYRHYHELVAESVHGLRGEILSSMDDWAREQQSLRPSRLEVLEKAKRASRITLSILVGLILAFVILAVLGMTIGGFLPLLGILALLIVILGIVLYADSRAEIRKAKASLEGLEADLQNEAEQILGNGISDAYAIALRNLLSSEGVLEFPTEAPRLVELNPDSIVASRSITHAQTFVMSHETSALGVSGPRGVGKSTLLSAVVRKARAAGALAVLLPAPVEYSVTDLLRSVAYAIRDECAQNDSSRAEQRSRKQRISAGIAVTLSGLLILVGAVLPAVARTVWDWFLELWPFMLATVLLGAGVIVIVSGFSARSAAWRRPDPSARIRTLVADLEYEVARSGALTAKGWGVAEFGFTRSRSRRAPTHSDIVAGLRTSLAALTLRGTRRVVIAIDELDKLPSHEAAVRTINVLKDLLHFPGVHVLVTVSDEARSSFGLGHAERDAFDSTFDAILEIDRLTITDSRQIIDSRVVGFPEQLLILSHISAAGLARDLIRSARNFIDAASEFDSTPPWHDLARAVVFREGQALLSSYTRLAVDLSDVPIASKALDDVARLQGADLLATRLPTGLSDPLASIYARQAIQFATIEWLRLVDLNDLPRIAATVEKLRDAILLASQHGGGATALQLISTVRLPDIQKPSSGMVPTTEG
ncbi:ATP-binding protein [Leifsonia shinshuensis]|uniref:AAA family ATPase n=1 Tax=Leifsonia shinshuensis TaxID=150026 RepID=UPI001F50FAB6|nr:AAA family ATPase [Leifsonia shinshuensis]MCI0155738.1 ATP-binding protein [Leifsonia shinshuensis]